MTESRYIGRFAPSPTGALHFGSLLAAVGSYLQARRAGGQWLVRMEDIDPPREMPGAADDILRTLEAFGLEWDGAVLYQSQRGEYYREALEQLLRDGLAYHCSCSRKEAAIAAEAAGLPGWVYPGTCRTAHHRAGPRHAVRVLTDDAPVAFVDALQGPQSQRLLSEAGDFVVRRADGLWAYQLAVVVDDAAQGISEVVRGSDLLDSTPRQLHLQRLLGLAQPDYLHLPVAVNAAGQKLSKQTFAPPLDRHNPVPALWAALTFLGQAPEAQLRHATLAALWQWALSNWKPHRLPPRRSIEQSVTGPME